jgi:hypothetical protein
MKTRRGPKGVRSHKTNEAPWGALMSKGLLKRQGHLDLQSNSVLLYSSLQNRTMYHFLEKLITCFASLTSQASNIDETSRDWKVQDKCIQIRLDNRQVRLFPEIQNHFEFFECLKSIQIKIITSGDSQEETRLLWTGLQQKEI